LLTEARPEELAMTFSLETVFESFNVFVSYEPIPNFAGLQKRFPGVVSDVYGNWRTKYIPHESNARMAEFPRGLIFCAHRFSKPVNGDAAVEEGLKRNLRQPSFKESLAFVNAYPDFQMKYFVASLGTAVTRGDERFLPVFGRFMGKPSLGAAPLATVWAGFYCFLYVQK